jgi:hypothetical protein
VDDADPPGVTNGSRRALIGAEFPEATLVRIRDALKALT